MKTKLLVISLLLAFCGITTEVVAQSNVFHRDAATTGNWWDGSNPWWIGVERDRPDRSNDRAQIVQLQGAISAPERSHALKYYRYNLMMAEVSVIPPPNGDPGNGNGQPVPLGGGLLVLATLGMAYGAAKLYRSRKKKS